MIFLLQEKLDIQFAGWPIRIKQLMKGVGWNQNS